MMDLNEGYATFCESKAGDELLWDIKTKKIIKAHLIKDFQNDQVFEKLLISVKKIDNELLVTPIKPRGCQ